MSKIWSLLGGSESEGEVGVREVTWNPVESCDQMGTNVTHN